MKNERSKIGGLALGLTFFTFYFLLFTSGTASASMRPSITLATNPNLTNGLVGHWTFDGPDTQLNIRDRSQSYATGSLIMGSTGSLTATTSIDGRLGGALSFDGTDDYVSLGSRPELDQNGPMTVSAWIKPGVIAGGTMAIVSNCGPSLEGDYQLEINRTSGKLSALWATTVIITGNTTLNANVWYFVTLVRSGSTGSWVASLYINGILDNSVSSATNPNAANQPTAIGQLPSQNLLRYKGAIDDVRIYNRALSSGEVARLYSLGATTNIAKTIRTNPNLATGLVRHWTLDGPDVGSHIRDISGYFATGSLVMGSGGKLAATTTTDGALGQALRFGGIDDFMVSSLATGLPTGASPFTISAWVRTAQAGAAALTPMYVQFGALATAQSAHIYVETTNLLGAGFYAVNCSVPTSISDNKWHYLVFKYTGGTSANILKDGVSYFCTLSQAANVVAGNTYLGWDGGVQSFVDGGIDDVRIYNYALATSTIQRLYSLGATTKVSKTLTTNPNLTNGLVGHWTFDGPDMTTNIRDRSSSYATGSLIVGSSGTLTATTTTDGRLGQALKFDGTDDYVNVASGGYLNLTTYTTAFWLKANTAPANAIITQAIGKGTGNYTFSWDHTSAAFGQACAHSTGGGSYGAAKLTSILRGAIWYFITCTYDGTSIRAYLNGRLEATTAWGSPDGGSQPVFIGAGPGASPSNYFPGSLDDVRVYNRALSASEVSRLYDLGK